MTEKNTIRVAVHTASGFAYIVRGISEVEEEENES
jgi:hypothetical protein